MAVPPLAASIGLYLFHACARDEVIERNLALKVVIDNLQFLIFPSSELPLRNCRYNSKIFLWVVFKKTRRSCTSAEASSSGQQSTRTQLLGFSEAIAIGNKEDLVCSERADYPSQNDQCPMSMKRSQ
ncbi:hypothetical protein OROMI_017161 [Orobanche minor]